MSSSSVEPGPPLGGLTVGRWLLIRRLNVADFLNYLLLFRHEAKALKYNQADTEQVLNLHPFILSRYKGEIEAYSLVQ